MEQTVTFIVVAAVLASAALVLWSVINRRRQLVEKLHQKFPRAWRQILAKKVLFYKGLNDDDKRVFEKRVQLFIATKNIGGVEAEVDDTIRLIVASSAVIPSFAFPEYNYPYVKSILIYPGSFDSAYQTNAKRNRGEAILGMVQGNFHNGTVIFSKPDLLKAFDGLPHKENVGIHEFVHLLDQEDGEIDGVPELLMQHAYVGPWLKEIKQEIKRIEKGTSDINPYALTNNAEFLAVVSEYFFENPEKFKRRHLKLYQFLLSIFNNRSPDLPDAN